MTFSRVQENCSRAACAVAVICIDQSVKLNGALWIMAEEMRKLNA